LGVAGRSEKGEDVPFGPEKELRYSCSENRRPSLPGIGTSSVVSITIVEISGSEFICKDILFIARMLIFGANQRVPDL
jgi:hypothetical protein